MENHVYEYIRSYFQRKFPEYYFLFDKQRMSYIDKMYIAMIKEDIMQKYEYQDIIDGKKNKEIEVVLNNYVNMKVTMEQRNEYRKLYRYCFNFFREYDVNNDFSSDIYDHIIKTIVVKMWQLYGGIKLDRVNFKDDLIRYYDDGCKRVRENTYIKVVDMINANLNITDMAGLEIDNVNMMKYIVYRILSGEKRDFLRRLGYVINDMDNVIPLTNDKMEQYVDNSLVWKKIKSYMKEYVDRTTKKEQHDENMNEVDTVKYITDYIINNVDSTCSHQDVYSIAVEIDKYLRREGLDSQDIMLVENQKVISSRYMRYKMKYNSVVSNDAPPKIRKNGFKRKFTDALLSLLVISTLLGSSAAISMGIYHFSEKDKTIKTALNYDGNYYGTITSIHDKLFKETVNNVVDTFDDYSKFNNDNFKFLGFYRAFSSVKSQSQREIINPTSIPGREETQTVYTDQRLYVMDCMLSDVEQKISKDENKSGLYSEIRKCSCYLDFIYDRLDEMGFDKINESKYIEALQEYKKEKAQHPYKNPLDYMGLRNVKILENVIEKYEKYSEQYLLELGVFLNEQNNSETQGWLFDNLGGHKK